MPRAEHLNDGGDECWVEYLVGPTTTDGWTSIWSAWDVRGEDLVAYLAATLDTRALYGHHNDQTANWRWIRFAGAQQLDTYWYTGQLWVRFPDRVPAEAWTLGEAFAAEGRKYAHESLSSALGRFAATPHVTLVRALYQ